MSGDLLPPVVAVLQGEISDFKSKMADAKGEMAGVESEGKSRFSGMAGAIGGGLLAVGAAAVALGAKSIKTFSDTAASIDDLQDVTGESAEKMSKLQYAFNSWGISGEDASKMLIKLGKAVGSGNDAFEKYHIATKDAAGNTLPMSDIVANAADVFKGLPDGIDKSNLAMQLFGKSGTEVLDVMNGGSAGLKSLGDEAAKYGLVLGQDAVDGQQKNAASQRQMSAAWKGLQIQIGEHLMPIVQKLTGFLAEHLPQAIAFVKKALEFVQPAFVWLGEAIAKVIGFVQDVIAAFQGGGIGGAFQLLVDKVKEVGPKIGSALLELGGKFVSWIADVVPPMLAELGKLQLRLLSWIYTDALPAIGAQLLEWGLAFIKWIGPQIPPMLLELAKLLLKLEVWIYTEALPAILTKLGEWALAFVKWVGPAALDLLVELGKLWLKVQVWMVTVALPAILTKLGEWALAFVKWVGPAALDLLVELGKLWLKVQLWIGETAVDIALKAVEWGVSLLGWVAGFIISIPSKLAGLASGFLGWAGDMATDIAEAFGKIPGGIWSAFKRGWNAVADFATFKIPKVTIPMPPGVPDVSFGGGVISLLPHLAKGGVALESGLAVVGEHGAEVVDLPKGAAVYPHGSRPAGAGDGIVIHQTFNGITDVDRLARESGSATAWAIKTRAA